MAWFCGTIIHQCRYRIKHDEQLLSSKNCPRIAHSGKEALPTAWRFVVYSELQKVVGIETSFLCLFFHLPVLLKNPEYLDM